MKKTITLFILTCTFFCSALLAQDECSNAFTQEEISNAAFFGQFRNPQNPGEINIVRLATDFDVPSNKELTIESYSASWAFPPFVQVDSLSYAMIIHQNSEDNTVGAAIDTIMMVLDSVSTRGIWTPEGSPDSIPFSYYHLSPESEYTIPAMDENRKFWIELLLNPPTGEKGFAFWESATTLTPTLNPTNFNNNNSGWLAGMSGGLSEEVVYQLTASCRTGSVSTLDTKIGSTKIYPNPTTGIVHIEVEADMIRENIVYDMVGTVILKQDSRILDLSKLNNGSYIIKTIQKDGTEIINRIIKR